MDLRAIQAVNRLRCFRWHADSDAWTSADWSNAMCGEAGEAANVVKKIRRHETGAKVTYNTPPVDQLVDMLGEEIADVILYALLLADHHDIDVMAALVTKFNRVSEIQGFPERLHYE